MATQLGFHRGHGQYVRQGQEDWEGAVPWK